MYARLLSPRRELIAKQQKLGKSQNIFVAKLNETDGFSSLHFLIQIQINHQIIYICLWENYSSVLYLTSHKLSIQSNPELHHYRYNRKSKKAVKTDILISFKYTRIIITLPLETFLTLGEIGVLGQSSKVITAQILLTNSIIYAHFLCSVQ